MTSFHRGTPPKVFFDVPQYTPATAPLEGSSIPNNVFQCWMRKRFRKNMYNTWRSNVTNNPQFNFYVFSDADCRRFLVEHYDARTVAAYDTLLPGAYKADLWRLCALYKLGGIYMDMKFKCMSPLSNLIKGRSSILVKEAWQPIEGICAPHQAVLISTPGNDLFARGIEQILRNVETNYYGINDLDPTGPIMLGRLMTAEDHAGMTLEMRRFDNDLRVELYSNDTSWFRQYSEYRQEQAMDMVLYGSPTHYRACWDSRCIYKQ